MPAARFSKLTLPTPAAIARVSLIWPFCSRETATFSGLAAVLGWLGKTVWDTVKEQKNMKKAIKALLHDRLYQSSHFYLKQEFVDMEGLTNVGYIYESYHELGGNGTGTALYNKIKELPIRDS